jgi:hypothetical protein
MQVTKALIVQEIDRFSDNDLEALYELIQTFGQTRQQNKKASLMSQLRQIQIDGPEDFSRNLDLYLNGEKCD